MQFECSFELRNLDDHLNDGILDRRDAYFE